MAGKASALTYSILGLLKTLTCVILGIFLFDKRPSAGLILGGSLAMSAIMVYSIITMVDAERKKALDAARAQLDTAAKRDVDAGKH